MIPLRSFALLLASSLLLPAGFSQESTPTTIGASHEAVVTITLGLPSAIWSVVPNGSPEPVSAAPGTTLRFRLGLSFESGSSVEWLKNGDIVATTSEAFEIGAATIADSGTYSANIVNNGSTIQTATVVVRVMPPVHQQLVALASRTTISPSNPILIGGFLIGTGSNTGQGKPVLIRAVGPNLVNVGVSAPLAAPKLSIYTADGTNWDEMATPAVWLFGSLTYPDLSRIAGAFPLITGQGDVVRALVLPPGIYTAHVSSSDGGSGDVLLEIYELPESVLGAPWTHVPTPIDLPPPVVPSGDGL